MYFLELFNQSPISALVFVLSIVAAITIHEFAHAWTADFLGDDTPRLQGRVSLNPAAHIDPIGGLAFLLVGFGWGKPVIYNPMRLPKKIDELYIALAGPLSNIIFAIFINIIIFALHGHFAVFAGFLSLLVYINIILAAFNLLPIPPLDGSSLVAYFWPDYRSAFGGQIGLVILLIVMFSGALSYIISPLITLFTHISTLFGLLP